MAAAFFDATGSKWQSGALSGKFAGASPPQQPGRVVPLHAEATREAHGR